MSYRDNYIPELLKYMSDLESTTIKHAEAESRLRELEAKVAELEENERHWQEERQILLKRVGDKNEGKSPT